MKEHKVLKKIEIAGLLALVGLFQPGMHSTIVNDTFVTEVEAKSKTVKKTYFPGTKTVSSQSTAWYHPNGGISKMEILRYNRSGLLASSETITYNNRGVKLKRSYTLYDYQTPSKYKITSDITFKNGVIKKGVKEIMRVYNPSGQIHYYVEYTYVNNHQKVITKEQRYANISKALIRYLKEMTYPI